MTTLVELKPCPFCGMGGVSYAYEKSRLCFVVTCNVCDAEGPEQHEEAGAVTAWNTRASDPVIERQAKAIDEARKLIGAVIQWGCPVCSGDCASANPPVSACPMRDYVQTLEMLTTLTNGGEDGR